MLNKELLDQVFSLPDSDRAELAERIWDSLRHDAGLTDEQKKLLDGRLRDMEENPGDEVPWEKVQAELARSTRESSMSLGFTVRRLALSDIREAAIWYDSQRPGVGDEFRHEVRTAMEQIQERPLAFPVVHKDIRRAITRRFPYLIFYRILRTKIVVIAVQHGHRNPQAWQDRS